MKEEILISIKILDELIDIASISSDDDYKYSKADRNKLYNLCKVALQEQLGRLEGCDMCSSTIGFFSGIDGNISVNIIDANHCPNCGRKLRGEEND